MDDDRVAKIIMTCRGCLCELSVLEDEGEEMPRDDELDACEGKATPTPVKEESSSSKKDSENDSDDSCEDSCKDEKEMS